MKKHNIKFLLAAALSLLAVPAGAQNLGTAHFLDNYLFGYRLNPSVTPYRTSGFVTLGVGNVSLSSDMSVGLSHFLFPVDGKLVTGFNDAVTYDQFIGPLPDLIKVGVDLSENLLAFASTSKKGTFRNFEINLVTKDYFSTPKDLFKALKPNETNTSFETITANDINLRTSNYVEVAFGRSKRLFTFMGFGFRLKGIVGLADLSMNIESMSFTPDVLTGNIDVTGKGSFTAAAKPVAFPVVSGEYDFMHPRRGSLRPAGIGAGLDAGATFYFWQDRIQLGLAVQDLGFINWTNDKYGKMEYVASYTQDDLKGSNAVSKLLRFKPDEQEVAAVKKSLPTHYNASVKFKPIQFVTLGAVADLANYDGNSDFGLRFGLALTPFRQLNLAASYATSKIGQSVGLAASVRLLGISVYAGIDSFLSNTGDGFKPIQLSPQYIPIKPLNTTVNLGVAIAFGQSKERAAEVNKTKVKSKKVKEQEKEESLEDLEAVEEEKAPTEPKTKSKKLFKKKSSKKSKKGAETPVEEIAGAAAAATAVAEGAAAAGAAAAAVEAGTAVIGSEAAAAAAQAIEEKAAAEKAIEEAKAAQEEEAKAKAEAEAEMKAAQEAKEAQMAAEAQAAKKAAEDQAAAAAAEAAKQAQEAQQAAAAEAEAAAKAASMSQEEARNAAIAAAEAEAKAAEEAAAKAAAEAEAALNETAAPEKKAPETPSPSSPEAVAEPQAPSPQTPATPSEPQAPSTPEVPAAPAS